MRFNERTFYFQDTSSKDNVLFNRGNHSPSTLMNASHRHPLCFIARPLYEHYVEQVTVLWSTEVVIILLATLVEDAEAVG
jgi:hypothetical protein